MELAAENCFFETGKYKIQPESLMTLREVVEILTADSLLRLYIEGYIDRKGNKKLYQILNKNLTYSIMNYFIENGISANDLLQMDLDKRSPLLIIQRL